MVKSSPMPRSRRVYARPAAGCAVSPAMFALGVLVICFGAGLAGSTLFSLIAGIDVGFFDLAIGGMFLAFSWQSAKFGFDVMTGRQTLTGQYVR